LRQGQGPPYTYAAITKTTDPNTISREQVEGTIVVMCNVAGGHVASVFQDVEQLVDPLIAGGPGYAVADDGQFESVEETGWLLSVRYT
jgi:Cu/Ag efflux pump CusA